MYLIGCHPGNGNDIGNAINKVDFYPKSKNKYT